MKFNWKTEYKKLSQQLNSMASSLVWIGDVPGFPIWIIATLQSDQRGQKVLCASELAIFSDMVLEFFEVIYSKRSGLHFPSSVVLLLHCNSHPLQLIKPRPVMPYLIPTQVTAASSLVSLCTFLSSQPVPFPACPPVTGMPWVSCMWPSCRFFARPTRLLAHSSGIASSIPILNEDYVQSHVVCISHVCRFPS